MTGLSHHQHQELMPFWQLTSAKADAK